MEQAVIVKKNLLSKVGSVVIPRNTIVIYCDKIGAVKVASKRNKSDIWFGVSERDIEIIGWKKIK
jgi:hypothetical protein